MKRYAYGILTMLIVMFFFSCATTTPISSISEDPQKYSGKTVLIDGEVLNVIHIPFVDSSLFLFGDGEWKAPVVSPVLHEKGETFRLTGRVMAFPEEGSKEASHTVVRAIADFLVEQQLVEEDKAEKTGNTVLKALYRLSEGLGQVFFIIEGDAPTR